MTPEQLATVLDALDVAAEYRRDRVETCPDCPGRPGGLCHTCAWRLDLADEYDTVARELREGGTGGPGTAQPGGGWISGPST